MAVLSYADVSGWIAATLIGRGHEIAFIGAAVHDALLEALADYDGCLLLGEEPEFKALAAAFSYRGKAVWHDWTAIPPASTAAC